MAFASEIDISLKLTIDGTTFPIQGSQVKRFEIDLLAWGFDADVTFVISAEGDADELLAKFTTTDLATAVLTVKEPARTDDQPVAAPIVLTGFVSEKSVQEEAFQQT